MVSKERSYKLTAFIEKLILLFMVFATILTAIFAFEHFFSEHEANWRGKLESERIEITENLAGQSDPSIFISSSILPIIRIVDEFPHVDINEIAQAYKKNLNLELNIYRFDPKGKMIETAPKRATNLWIMRNMYPMLIEKDSQKIASARKELDNKIEHSFGYGKNLASIRDNAETIISTIMGGKESILTWSQRSSGGLIITSSTTPSNLEIFQNIIKKEGKVKDLIEAGIIDNFTHKSNFELRAFEKAKRLSKNHTELGDKHWIFMPTRLNRTIFASFKIVPYPHEQARYMCRLLTLLLTSVGVYLLLFSSQKSALSLKHLIISVFVVSSTIPLAGIGFIALTNINVFRLNHENKLQAEAEESIGNIILNFNTFRAETAAKIIELTKNPGQGAKDPITQEITRKIEEEFPRVAFNYRNTSSEVIYSNEATYADGRETVYKSISNRVLERYAPRRLEEGDYSGNLFADGLVRKDDMGFSTLTSYPGELQFIQIGDAFRLFFYSVIQEPNAPVAYIQLDYPAIEGIKQYLRRTRTATLAAEGLSLQISAFDPKGFRWITAPLRKYEKQILNISQAAATMQKTIFRQITDELGALKGFAISVPANNLEGVCLTAFAPYHSLEKSLQKMQRNLIIACLVAIVLLYSVIKWLMSQLIQPLNELGRGIQALSDRKFETKITVPPYQDELSNLFNEFNFMMGESYDMQIAQNVQDGLITKYFPYHEAFSMYGLSNSQGELGGDCLNCFEAADGGIVFLIGDLTGHSVGSALMMAFVRAITFNWIQQENGSLEELVNSIDSILRNTGTKRVFMGIICGKLYPEQNQLELIVKGHIYPLKIDKDETLEWVGFPSYPLGISKRTPAKSFTLPFQPGDKLLCVTDGLLEALNHKNQMLGFDNIEKLALKHSHYNAKTWLTSIYEAASQWANHKFVDDTTMFALSALEEGQEVPPEENPEAKKTRRSKRRQSA
jgi:HAMP domain-containing protein